MFDTTECSVPEDAEGQRLDSFLAGKLEGVSRATVRRWIDAGRVTVDGLQRKPSYTLTAGQALRAEPAPPEASTLVPEDIPLSILYEDADLIVLDKPSGMVVHPGAGNWTGTLANALAYHFGGLAHGDALRPGIVHRLDKGTSGVLVVAKNEYAHEFLSKQFKARKVTKEYLTLVFGRVGDMSGAISLPIGRDIRSRTRISPRTNKPRSAVTEYQVIAHLKALTYLRVFPKTGRTHQIRVHLKEIGHPVVGDELYARGCLLRIQNPQRAAIKRMGRMFLHATSISILHPRLKELVTFISPLPGELVNLLTTLGE